MEIIYAIYIPEKIKVGFSKKNSTVNGLLSYIIYYDDKGKIRQEKTLKNFKDKNILDKDFDNKPLTGYKINMYQNDFISLYNKQLDIEFFISVQNFFDIALHNDIINKEIKGELIFSWNGSDLYLLSTNLKEYKELVNYTENKNKNISVKDLFTGKIYSNKKMRILFI